MSVHSIAAHHAFAAAKHLPRHVLLMLAEDLNEATWCEGRWSSAWFHVYTLRIGFRGYGEQVRIGLALRGYTSSSLTTDEAAELALLLIEKAGVCADDAEARTR